MLRALGRLTIILKSQRLIDDIKVIQIQLDLEIRQTKIELVIHWDKVVKITGRPRVPVFCQIANKSGVIAKQERPDLIQIDIERPISPSVPLQGCWHLGINLQC